MSLFNNPNWIGFDGKPVTGRVPAKAVVTSDTPGVQLTPQQRGVVQHAFKLFCDAVTVSAFPDGFHVQHREYPDGMKVRMESNGGQQRVFVHVNGGTKEPPLDYWGCYTVSEMIGDNIQRNFVVFKFDEHMSRFKTVLERNFQTDSQAESPWVTTTSDTTVYWVKEEYQSLPGEEGETLADEEHITDVVWRFTTVYSWSSIESRGQKDLVLGVTKRRVTSVQVKRTWKATGEWEWYSGYPELTSSPVVTRPFSGVALAGATPWGVLTLSAFTTNGALPEIASGVSYFAAPSTLAPLTEPTAVAWSNVVSANTYAPPEPGVAYAEAFVRSGVLNGSWRTTPGPHAYWVNLPTPPWGGMFTARSADWQKGGYANPDASNVLFTPANKRGLYQYGSAVPRLIDFSVVGSQSIRDRWQIEGLWSDKAAFLLGEHGEGLVLTRRDYKDFAIKVKTHVIHKQADLPSGAWRARILTGRDAHSLMRTV